MKHCLDNVHDYVFAFAQTNHPEFCLDLRLFPPYGPSCLTPPSLEEIVIPPPRSGQAKLLLCQLLPENEEPKTHTHAGPNLPAEMLLSCCRSLKELWPGGIQVICLQVIPHEAKLLDSFRAILDSFFTLLCPWWCTSLFSDVEVFFLCFLISFLSLFRSLSTIKRES